MSVRLACFKAVGASAAEDASAGAVENAVRGAAGSVGRGAVGNAVRGAVGSAGKNALRRAERSTGRSIRSIGGSGMRCASGSAVAEVVIMAAMLVFVIFPVFSSVMERYILLDKARLIRDSVDMTNISVYDALNAASLGKVSVDLFDEKAGDIFQELLCKNLKLDSGMMPRSDSIAEGRVEILSLTFYGEGVPAVCPNGSTIERPAVHSCVNIPIKPSLYRGIILNLLGRDHVDVTVHVDSEIPVNN
jgi:hypothetical protein